MPDESPSRRSLRLAGLLLATLFFAFSLTPSLLPRSFPIQGVVSGIAAAAGYAVGLLTRSVWRFVGLPALPDAWQKTVRRSVLVACLIAAIAFLGKTPDWQNSTRTLMGLEPVSSLYPVGVAIVAPISFAILLGLGRIFLLAERAITSRIARVVPARTARLVGITIAVLLFWGAVNGLLFRAVLRLADSSYREFDQRIEPEVEQPKDPLKPGSAESLLRWQQLGRAGRAFVSTGPTRTDIATFLRREAKEPIRVYVGLQSGRDAEARAHLALSELERVGGFRRRILVVVVPTGTGWVDSSAVDSLEYLHGGDTAIVAMQYSYLSSPLSLIVEPDDGAQAARALFQAIYGRWTRLPAAGRPRLYLHGLSLGAMNSERSAELFEMIGDPVQGALWSGPPFPSRVWRSITRRRNPGSPEWLPRFGDGSLVRFTAQENALGLPGAEWGPVRIVYLQYASDPVTFFDHRSLYRRPDWMREPRGPDVSPALRWYPIVTFLQISADMALFASAPIGHGHTFHPSHYIDGWVAVTAPQRWSPPEIARLKAHLAPSSD